MTMEIEMTNIREAESLETTGESNETINIWLKVGGHTSMDVMLNDR